MHSRVWPMLAVAVGAMTFLAACGLPTDSAPRVIARDKVPFSLLSPSPTSQGVQVGESALQLYFVDGDRLRAATRHVTDNSPQAALDALVRGPMETESALKGAIPPETRVLRADVDSEGTLTVVLTKDILSVTGPLQKTAFAQLVYTATGLDPVRQVRFKIADADGSNEQDVSPPTDGGATQGPLTRRDYDLLK